MCQTIMRGSFGDCLLPRANVSAHVVGCKQPHRQREDSKLLIRHEVYQQKMCGIYMAEIHCYNFFLCHTRFTIARLFFAFFPPLFQKCNHLLSLVICRISANTHKCKTGITRRGRNIVLCIQCIALSCFVLYCIILDGGGCGSFSSHTRIWDDKF